MIKLNNKKGFTLIELMIVIAIIGILAAIAIPNFIAYRNKAFCAKAETDAQSILAALSSYFSEPNRTTVPSIAELVSTEELVINQGNTGVDPVENADGSYTIAVTTTNKCPRGTTYTTYMGSSTTPGWSN